MNKSDLKKKVLKNIEKERAIGFLQSLIRLPSESGKATLAQELVVQKLDTMGFSIDRFSGNSGAVEKFPDYCPLPEGENIDPGAYNLVGLKEGNSKKSRSLLLFSHIDTEIPEFPTEKNVYEGELKEGKLYGLGAADAKSGIAIMLLAAEAVLKETDLDGDLILMSILGKRGGSAGTLSAVERGYSADGGIYIHSAETGHGFQEIKNYSMGTVDFKILIEGVEGVPRDELDTSKKNAVLEGMKVIDALVQWDKKRRETLLFEEGSYKGRPKTRLNIGLAKGGLYVGKNPLTFEINCRLYFGYGETIDMVIENLKTYFQDCFANDPWLSLHIPEIELMYLRASPAYVDADEPITGTVRQNIKEIGGEEDIIYQYHGASDIRLPILYGKTPTVGIGPRCGGLYGQEWTDWVDVNDYIKGIKIVASTIIDWCLEDRYRS